CTYGPVAPLKERQPLQTAGERDTLRTTCHARLELCHLLRRLVSLRCKVSRTLHVSSSDSVWATEPVTIKPQTRRWTALLTRAAPPARDNPVARLASSASLVTLPRLLPAVTTQPLRTTTRRDARQVAAPSRDRVREDRP